MDKHTPGERDAKEEVLWEYVPPEGLGMHDHAPRGRGQAAREAVLWEYVPPKRRKGAPRRARRFGARAVFLKEQEHPEPHGPEGRPAPMRPVTKPH